MNSLQILSNTAIPLLLLFYFTLQKLSRKQKLGYGQWFCMIIILILTNFLSCFIKIRGWILVFDLVIKIVIVLLPSSINTSIQSFIKSLRLQKQIQSVRKIAISKLFVIHLKLTEYMLTKMDDSQIKHFRSVFIDKLSLEHSSQLKLSQLKESKKYQSIGITCDILINNETPTNPIIKQFIQKKYKEQKSKGKNQNNRSSSNKQQKHQSNLLPSASTHNLYRIHQQLHIVKDTKIPSNIKHSYDQLNVKRSSTNILDQINMEDQRTNKFQQNIQMMSFNQRKKNQSPEEVYNFKKSRKKVPEFSTDPEKLLDQLDVSASQYSQLFEDEDLNNEEKKLITKIEAIVQTGNGPNSRLEIYNLELYSNNDLRIVSLYGREFQKHKLISMKSLPNNYYQLKVSGTPVSQRKVKFRANAQPFMKYLI